MHQVGAGRSMGRRSSVGEGGVLEARFEQIGVGPEAHGEFAGRAGGHHDDQQAAVFGALERGILERVIDADGAVLARVEKAVAGGQPGGAEDGVDDVAVALGFEADGE